MYPLVKSKMQLKVITCDPTNIDMFRLLAQIDLDWTNVFSGDLVGWACLMYVVEVSVKAHELWDKKIVGRWESLSCIWGGGVGVGGRGLSNTIFSGLRQIDFAPTLMLQNKSTSLFSRRMSDFWSKGDTQTKILENLM